MSASDAIIGAVMFALVAISAMAVLGVPVWRAVVMAAAICLLALSLHHLARDRPVANVLTTGSR